MKKYTHIIILTGFLLITFASFGQEVILSWDAPGGNNEFLSGLSTEDDRDGVTNAGLEPSTIMRGKGLKPVIRSRTFSAIGFAVEREDAFRDGDYFEFEIIPKEGKKVSLSTLTAKFSRTQPGPREFIWQYRIDDVDCTFTDLNSFIFDITEPNDNNSTVGIQDPIDLSATTRLQNVSYPNKIIFRLYGWGADGGEDEVDERFGFGRNPDDINDLIIEGDVSDATEDDVIEPLPPTTWNGSSWDNGAPTTDTQPVREVVINGSYNTRTNGDILACSLTVNSRGTLRVGNGSFVEVINDVVANGKIIVATKGNFVQKNDSGTFKVGSTGVAIVKKESSIKKEWFHYTYWSSPVKNFTVGKAFEGVDNNRRFLFNGQNYIDADGNFADDDANAWVIVQSNEVLKQAEGYAITSPRAGTFPRRDMIDFEGEFNTGEVTTDVFFNEESKTGTWNLIGNPYPGAFDFDAFYAENSGVVDGIAYVWTQFSPIAAKEDGNNNDGNSGLNFNRDDYAMYNVGVGGVLGASPIRPTKFIPSGQSFFIQGLTNGQVTFNNSMRVADKDSNTQFFKSTRKSKRKERENRVWINLTSENTIFNQILIGYVRGATNEKDGLLFDAPRISAGGNALVYSKIKDSNSRYAIQGRHIDSIQHQDVVGLGFNNFHEDTTRVFSLSIDEVTGDFLEANPVYLRDDLLNITHNLSSGSYNFTSEVGEFSDRFQIEFKENVLSVKENAIVNSDYLTVRYLKNNLIRIDTNSNLTIANIGLYDILGKQLVSFKEDGATSEVSLLNYKNGIYIIKIKLSDGSIVSKKIIK